MTLTDADAAARRVLGPTDTSYWNAETWNSLLADANTLARAYQSLRAERVQLRRRLEIDRIWVEGDGGELVEQSADLPESQDGISCRDETIKLQDKRIAAAESRLAAVVEAGNVLLKSAADCSPSAPDAPPSAWKALGAAISADSAAHDEKVRAVVEAAKMMRDYLADVLTGPAMRAAGIEIQPTNTRAINEFNRALAALGDGT